MLIQRSVLDRIRAGEVSRVYRVWKRPAAKVGGRQRTPVGELAIESVEAVDVASLTAEDARQAGYPDVAALTADLGGREGTLYCIGLRWDRVDPRLALRDDTSDEAVAAILLKLARKDAVAEPWTSATLAAIAAEPGRRAADIAEGFGLEKLVFKRRVRQLKELGLTISLDVGYTLSARGEAVLAALDRPAER
ncbi:MAG: hypothetical protein R3F61_15415 [Myxococcota bacterium]